MSAAVCAMLALLALRPETYLDAVSEGLEIFAVSVFPGLFPFFVLTGLLTALGAGNLLSRAFAKPASRLFGAPPSGGYILAMSMLSGYPVGAKLVADFYKDGIIDEYDARAVTAFASTTGPLFVLGTIGVKMLGDYKSGVIILLTHFASAILNGIVFRAVRKRRETRLTGVLGFIDIASRRVYHSIQYGDSRARRERYHTRSGARVRSARRGGWARRGIRFRSRRSDQRRLCHSEFGRCAPRGGSARVVARFFRRALRHVAVHDLPQYGGRAVRLLSYSQNIPRHNSFRALNRMRVDFSLSRKKQKAAGDTCGERKIQ